MSGSPIRNSPPRGGGSDRLLALHPSTLLITGPEVAVEAAAAAGFGAVGVRLAPAYPGDPSPSLLADGALRRRVGDAVRAAGLIVLDVEVARLRPATRVDDLESWLEGGAELGASFLVTVSHDPDQGRTAAALHALAESAATRGMGVALEFMAFSEVRTAVEAARLVALAQHPSLGVIADPLHLFRAGGVPADLAGQHLFAAQLCDAPALAPSTPEGLAHEARNARLMPGEGALPLREFLAALPADLPLSLEVTNAEPEDPFLRARRGRAALRSFGL